MCFSIALALSAASVAATPLQNGAPPGVHAQLDADTVELTVGDVFTLSLIVSHPQDLTAVLPRPEREWGPFQVLAQTSAQTVSLTGGAKTVAKQFRVTLFAPGTLETPNLPVSIRGPDGDVSWVSPTPLRLTVNPVLLSPGEELKDLRAPVDLSTPFWRHLALAALLLVAVVGILGGVIYLIVRRLRAAGASPEIMPDASASWEVAAHELERAIQLDLPGQGQLREHYALLSGILRSYLGATYLSDERGTDAADMSTQEIAGAIGLSSLDFESARMTVELLREADLVKFANHEPTAEQARAAVGKVWVL